MASMTLDEAIAELRRVTRIDGDNGQGDVWTGADFAQEQPAYDPHPIDHAIATILNAVLSGDLILTPSSLANAPEVAAIVEEAMAQTWPREIDGFRASPPTYVATIDGTLWHVNYVYGGGWTACYKLSDSSAMARKHGPFKTPQEAVAAIRAGASGEGE